MIRLLGSVLILSAAVSWLLSDRLRYRRETETAQELRAALTEMATAIRWQGVTVPDAIRSIRPRPFTDRWFGAVLEALRGHSDLYNAWIDTFNELAPPELADILCRVSFCGDREHLLTSLQLADRQIGMWLTQKQRDRRESQRTRDAVALSGAGLLIIMLL